MAIKFADFKKNSGSRAIKDMKTGTYKGLAVRQITLENGKVGLIGEDQFDEFMAKNGVDINGDLGLSEQCRLTNKGFWTDREKTDSNEGFQTA